jgi:hypothetical protein
MRELTAILIQIVDSLVRLIMRFFFFFFFLQPQWQSISEECKHLVASLLRKDPLDRLTCDGILKHPWMRHPAFSSAWAATNGNLAGSAPSSARSSPLTLQVATNFPQPFSAAPEHTAVPAAQPARSSPLRHVHHVPSQLFSPTSQSLPSTFAPEFSAFTASSLVPSTAQTGAGLGLALDLVMDTPAATSRDVSLVSTAVVRKVAVMDEPVLATAPATVGSLHPADRDLNAATVDPGQMDLMRVQEAMQKLQGDVGAQMQQLRDQLQHLQSAQLVQSMALARVQEELQRKDQALEQAMAVQATLQVDGRHVSCCCLFLCLFVSVFVLETSHST